MYVKMYIVKVLLMYCIVNVFLSACAFVNVFIKTGSCFQSVNSEIVESIFSYFQ